jgi:hypothetical protein
MPRVEPILYKKIYLFHEHHAQRLVRSLTFWSKTVVFLFLGASILPDMITRLLRLCPGLMVLNLRVGGNTFCHFKTILNAINNLTYLRDLSFDPALLFGTRFMYLPDAVIFH